MVSAVGVGMLLCLLSGDPGQGRSLSLHYWAVQAVQENRGAREYDAPSSRIRDALDDLNFDTFTTIGERQLQLSPGKEERIPLAVAYTLRLMFDRRDESGRARVAVTVELAAKASDAPPRKVVETTLLLAPQRKARVGGLRLEKGELVLVFSAE